MYLVSLVFEPILYIVQCAVDRALVIYGSIAAPVRELCTTSEEMHTENVRCLCR